MVGSPGTCRICESRLTPPLKAEAFEGTVYHTAYCVGCDLYQTAERSASFAPTYVNLSQVDMDEARLWCQGGHKLSAFRQWARLMRQRTPRLAGRVLDVGCGTGGFLEYVQSLGLEGFGFDGSAAQVAVAQREAPCVRHAKSPFEYVGALGLEKLRFEYVTMWDVLEHLQDPIRMLKEVAALLAPGGLVFVSLPNGRAIRWKLWLGRVSRRKVDLVPWEHICYFTRHSLGVCLGKGGLRPVATGAVVCYGRPLSAFEVVRRVGFRVLQLVPDQAPQIWGLATVDPSSALRDPY